MDGAKTGTHGSLSGGAAQGIDITSPAFAQNAKGRATRGAPDPGSTIRIGSPLGGFAVNPTNGQIGGYVGKSFNLFGQETGATLTATVGRIGTNNSCGATAHR